MNPVEGAVLQCSFGSSAAYPAKILKVDISRKNGEHYYIHYQGWNKRYDEWVPLSRFKTSASKTRIDKKPAALKTAQIKHVPKVKATPVKPSAKPVAVSALSTKRAGPAFSKSARDVASETKDKTLLLKPTSEKSQTERITRRGKRPIETSLDGPAVKRRAESKDVKKNVSAKSDSETKLEEPTTFTKSFLRGAVVYKNSSGKTLTSLAEARKYFKQNRLIFIESEFNFSAPISSKESSSATYQPLSPRSRHAVILKSKAKTVADTKKVIASKSKKRPEKLKVKSKIKPRSPKGKAQSDFFKKLLVSTPKIKKLLPIKGSDKLTVFTPDTTDNEAKFSEIPMQLEIASNSPEPTDAFAQLKSVEFSFVKRTKSPSFGTSGGGSDANRPIRSRKPNQRFNILQSEYDFLQQGRRRRYSSRHSGMGTDDEGTPAAESPKKQSDKSTKKKVGKLQKPEKKAEIKPKAVKIRKEKKSAVTSKTKKPKNQRFSTSAMQSSSDFDTAPEFVEIQARAHSPQDQDDGLPPALNMSPDVTGLRSQSLDPLTDNMCDALAAASSIDTPPNMDHLENSPLMSDFSSNLHHLSSVATDALSMSAMLGSRSPPSIVRERKQRMRSPRQPGGRKMEKAHLSNDDFPTLESYKMSSQPVEIKEKSVVKERRLYSPDMDTSTDSGPGITSEEIDDGLKMLQTLESQSVKGLSAASFPAITSSLTGISARFGDLSKFGKPKDTRRGGRAPRSSLNIELPRLHRESDSVNDFDQIQMKTHIVEQRVQHQHHQQQQHQPLDETARYCYLPPEIVGDHCYGKSVPSSGNFSSPGNLMESPTSSTTYSSVHFATSVAPSLLRLTPSRGGRAVRFDALHHLHQQHHQPRSSPSPTYKSSAFLMGDPMGAYSAFNRLADVEDYGGGSGAQSSTHITPSSVVLPASMMSGAEVPMLSGNLPANILDDDFNDDSEVTSVNIQ